MTTFTADRAASTFPTFQGPSGGIAQIAWGKITVALNPIAADVYQLCKLPAGCWVHGGELRAGSIDSGTETLDMDWGWAANGVEAADPDGFGNLGTWVVDAITNLKPTVGILFPMQGVHLTTGPLFFSAETTVIVTTITTASAGFASAVLSCWILYSHSGARV